MAKLPNLNTKLNKENVKTFLTRPVRIGFLSVPLWLAGAYFIMRRMRSRRRYA
jgi:hypothetical protein